MYLIHGIGQTSLAMQSLYQNLTNLSYGIDTRKYHVDAGYTFACATSCGGACSAPAGSTLLNLGAQLLASYIQQQAPPGNIILVGYSMGGLIARDFIANNGYGLLNGHPVTALITLGTPHLGYPYSALDQLPMCPQLLLDMSGSWEQTNFVELTSPYLDNLRARWTSASYSGYWMAAAGESCTNRTRNLQLPGETSVGCPSWAVSSDGVVCSPSALYGGPVSGYGYLNDGPKPIFNWYDTEQRYVHTNSWGGWGTAAILCGNSGDPSLNPQLFDPPPARTLFPQIKEIIDAH